MLPAADYSKSLSMGYTVSMARGRWYRALTRPSATLSQEEGVTHSPALGERGRGEGECFACNAECKSLLNGTAE